MQVLDAIICYNSLPHICLQIVIITLCRTLNLKEFCEESWKLMRNLLGTHLGHSCIETMCHLLQDKSVKEYDVLRSAVCFIGMGLWGTKCVPTLVHKPQSILPFFRSALTSNGVPLLAFEISLNCQRLVKKFGHELHMCAWDCLLDILEKLLALAGANQNNEQCISLGHNAHEILTLIEKLHQMQAFSGSADELFQIVEKHLKNRPIDSILLLILHRSQALNPSKSNWIDTLLDFINIYYRSSSSIKVKLKVLEIIENVVITNMEVYEMELVDDVILPKFQGMLSDTSCAIQENVVKFLLKMSLLSRTNRCISILHMLKPFTRISAYTVVGNDEAASCIECTVSGLVKLFSTKFYGAHNAHAVEAFRMMLCFIESYYQNDNLLKHPFIFKTVRHKVFQLLFQIRANRQLQLFLNDNPTILSGLFCLDHQQGQSFDNLNKSIVSNTNHTISFDLVVPFQRAFSCFSQCLVRENYWPILEFTINELCKLLENKCLIVAINPVEIGALAESLTGLISNSSRIVTLSGAPPTFKRPDLIACGLRAITVIVSLHEYLNVTRQRQILRCLEAGFNSKCARQCIAATTLCVVEMKHEALLRNLPSILLRLSQMSATVALATAVLELLSTLSQLPHLYSDFVDDQYMSVFKIALQHADPGKFSLYVVSLAHHVINMWFVKCRLAFRPDFVRYITLSLQNNRRTSGDNALQHSLIESCIDVMARYTFSSSMPVVSQTSKQRGTSKSGCSATWLLGNRLITIRTDVNLEKSKNKTNLVISDTNPPLMHDAVHAEKKISFEAPGKLQSSDVESLSTTRQRHKSSGSMLLPSTAADSSLLPLKNNSMQSDNESNNGLPPASAGSTWVEIYIRRPSGNNFWLLNSHQLSMTLDSGETSGKGFSHSAALSLSTSDLRKQENENEDTNESDITRSLGDETGRLRQRSRTVSSSHDYAVDAAAKARAKARDHLAFKSSLSHKSKRLKQSEQQQQMLSPEYVFLQLFQSSFVADGLQKPLLLPNSATMERSVSVLDLIPPYDTWETGVVYVRPGQSDDGKAILRNVHGSARYQNLLASLGTLVSLSDCNPSCTHLGGLDYAEGEDGDVTYVWQECVMQMVFHVTTLMPNLESGVSNKQRHIGNDYVTIVYDDNCPSKYVPGSVVKGQFLSVEIVITPLDLGYNSVNLVYHKSELKDILQVASYHTVTDDHLPLLVRQLALHASMASAAHHHKTPEKFVSKALARLKQIKHIRSRALQEITWKNDEKIKRYKSSSSELYQLEDFSYFVS